MGSQAYFAVFLLVLTGCSARSETLSEGLLRGDTIQARQVNLNGVTVAPTPPPSLYPDNGAVTNLVDTTFYQTVQDSQKSWLVLFYSSWCGHCIHYVPTYKATANNLKVWGEYVGVAAVNCVVDRNWPICRDHRITGFPMVVYVPSHTKDTATSRLDIPYVTYNDANMLTDYAEKKVRSANPDATPKHVDDISTTIKPEMTTKIPTVNDDQSVIITKDNSSVLYYEDLIYALKYSLVTEVGGHLMISGEKLQALKDYLSMLSLTFPKTENSISQSLKWLNERIQLISGSITHDDWTRLLDDSGMSAELNSRGDLVRCRGSQPQYRGYPCTLWSLFHTLTVQAAAPAMAGQKQTTSYTALNAMRGYIANFFTCQQCREHFTKMAVEVDAMVDKSDKAAVIWLWSAHNRVNKRLAGDTTEDPLFPKIQFPSVKACPDCKTPNGIWDEDKVYGFLQSAYTNILQKP